MTKLAFVRHIGVDHRKARGNKLDRGSGMWQGPREGREHAECEGPREGQ